METCKTPLVPEGRGLHRFPGLGLPGRGAQSQGPDPQEGVLLPPVHREGYCERVLGMGSVGSCSWWGGNMASIGALVALAGTS